MTDLLLSYGVASYVSEDILIVPFQADFYEEVIDALRQDILIQLHHRPKIKGLIIDLSRVDLIDLENMKSLEQTLHMASLLGVTGFLVGIKPSVTLALIDMGYEQQYFRTALNIERAVSFIHNSSQTEAMNSEEAAIEDMDVDNDT